MALQLAAPVCTCRIALPGSLRSRFPRRLRRTRHRRPSRLPAAVRLAACGTADNPEQPARFKQVIKRELRRLSRMAEGALDEQRLQAAAQQFSHVLLLTSATTLLSSLQQTPIRQCVTVSAIQWQAGPQRTAQGVRPGGRVRIRPAEHSILHALLSGLGLSTETLRQAVPSHTLFQTAHQLLGRRSLR